MNRKRDSYVNVSVFRRHPKMGDETLIRLVYYFCNGMPVDAVAKTLELSRKSVRAHYMELRTRLTKPKFRRWHAVFNALVAIPDPEEGRRLKGTLMELMAGCYYRKCYGNFVTGNRKQRICRKCPLRGSFDDASNLESAIDAIDTISQFYRTLGIRNDVVPDKQAVFLGRFIHSSVMSCLQEKSKKQANGLLDPNDQEFEGAGTLMRLLMDDLAADNAPPIGEPR